MRRRVALLALVAVLSGCLEGPAPEPEAEETEPGVDLCGRSPAVHPDALWARAREAALNWSANAVLAYVEPDACFVGIPEEAEPVRGVFELRYSDWIFGFADATRHATAFIVVGPDKAEVREMQWSEESFPRRGPLDPAWLDSSRLDAVLRQDPRAAPFLDAQVCTSVASLSAMPEPLWKVQARTANETLMAEVSPVTWEIISVRLLDHGCSPGMATRG